MAFDFSDSPKIVNGRNPIVGFWRHFEAFVFEKLNWEHKVFQDSSVLKRQKAIEQRFFFK